MSAVEFSFNYIIERKQAAVYCAKVRCKYLSDGQMSGRGSIALGGSGVLSIYTFRSLLNLYHDIEFPWVNNL